MAQKQERSLETESALLRAALKLSLTKDAEKVTIREICTEAAVSIGAFYHHFSSRQELFHLAFETFDRTLSQHMLHRIQSKPPVEALTDLLLFQVTFVSQEANGALSYYFRTILDDPMAASVNPDRTYYRTAYDCAHRIADAGLLLPGCSPAMLAESAIIFIRGYLLDWCLHHQNYDIVARIRSVLPIFLRCYVANPEQANR